MTWAKLDDGFCMHPKVVAAGNEAVGLYCRGLAYCAKYLTDGFIPEEVARSLTQRKQPIERLVACGLWTKVEGGFDVHDYLDFNPSREEKGEERELKASVGRIGGIASGRSRKQAKGEANAKQAASNNEVDAEAKGQAKSNETRSRTRTRTRTPVEREAKAPLSTSRLSNLLADLIAKNDPNGVRPTVNKGWIDAERLMIERDGRKPEQIEELIRWVMADDFESGNVLSMPKLRERYAGLWQKAHRRSSAQQRADAVNEQIKAGLEGRIQ